MPEHALCGTIGALYVQLVLSFEAILMIPLILRFPFYYSEIDVINVHAKASTISTSIQVSQIVCLQESLLSSEELLTLGTLFADAGGTPQTHL